jgi:hypothetical protein
MQHTTFQSLRTLPPSPPRGSLCSLDGRIVVGRHGVPSLDPEGTSCRSARQPDQPAAAVSRTLVGSGGEERCGEGGGKGGTASHCRHSRDPRRIQRHPSPPLPPRRMRAMAHGARWRGEDRGEGWRRAGRGSRGSGGSDDAGSRGGEMEGMEDNRRSVRWSRSGGGARGVGRWPLGFGGVQVDYVVIPKDFRDLFAKLAGRDAGARRGGRARRATRMPRNAERSGEGVSF